VIIYDISCIGFHDKFIINFYKYYKLDTDLNNIFDSLLLRLLLLKSKYSYLMGLFNMEILRFDIILLMKLL